MFQEKRPTCVTVIGWVWIVLGALMCFSAIMAFFSFSMITEMSTSDPDFQNQMPGIFQYFDLIAILQFFIALLGLISGINFLKLKKWSRNTLEILTWVMLLFIIGFSIFWEFQWLSMTQAQGPRGFDLMGAIMGIVVVGIYSIPLGIMLKYLRGDKVKSAMSVGLAEQVNTLDS